MILPIALDLTRVPVALIGRGARAARRLAMIEADGVARARVFSDDPDAAFAAAAGARLVRRLPGVGDLAGCRVVFVADYPPEEVEPILRAGYAAGALINVEDQRGWCDFHTPALVRRGDLTIAISTNGKSPALARRLRLYLSALFPPAWAERLDRLAALRRELRAAGATPAAIAAASDAAVAQAGWLGDDGAAGRDRPLRAPALAA